MKKFNSLLIQVLFVMFLPAFLWAQQTPLAVFNQKIKSQALVTQKVTQALAQKLDPQYFKVQVKIDLATHSLELQKAHITLQLSEALPQKYRQQLGNWLTHWVEKTYGVTGEAKVETFASAQPAVEQEIISVWADLLLLLGVLLAAVVALSRLILKSRPARQLSFAFASEKMQAPYTNRVSVIEFEEGVSSAQLPLVAYVEPQTTETVVVNPQPVFALAAFNEALDFDETIYVDETKPPALSEEVPVVAQPALVEPVVQTNEAVKIEETAQIKETAQIDAPKFAETVKPQEEVITATTASTPVEQASTDQVQPSEETELTEQNEPEAEITFIEEATQTETVVTEPTLVLEPVVSVEPFIEQAVEIVSPYAFIENLSNHHLTAMFFYLTLPQQVAFLMKAPRPTVQRLTSSLEKQAVTKILATAATTCEASEEELLVQMQLWQETEQQQTEEVTPVVDQDAEKYLRLKEIWLELPRKEKVELLEQLAQDNAKLEKLFLQDKEDINSLKYWPTEKLRKFCLQARSRELAAAIKVWPFLSAVILPVCPQTMKKEVQFEMITMDEVKLELNFNGFVTSFDRFITKATQKNEANLLQIKTKLLE